MHILIACPIQPEFVQCRRALGKHLTSPERGIVRGRVAGTEVTAVRSGLGKARSAARLARVCAQQPPHLVVDTGSCGGLAPDVPVGTVIIAAGCVEFRLPGHRLPRLMRRLERRPTGLSRLPERPRRELLRRLEAKNVAVGDIACNEVVVDDASLRNRIHQETGAFAATFETAAVGAVAEEYEIPWLSFRVVTDTASGAAALQFARTVARETASLYDWIVDLVEYGWFDTFREASDGKGGSRCFDSSSLG